LSGSVPAASGGIHAFAVEGIGEVAEGTDLAGIVAAVPGLAGGDVVLVTSKVVSKAEGRVAYGDRGAAVDAETVRVVARRGETVIAENRLGLVMAAAGVDASNVAPVRVALLPVDPDGSAQAIRQAVRTATGHNVAVVVTDTAGRPWREGQTDIAIGVAGIEPVLSLAGVEDGYGNPLSVTAPALADELAGVADLVAGKLDGRPVVVVRGLGARVLPSGADGPGARALLRPRGQDMFGLGAREAVLAAVRGEQGGSFGSPATPAELAAVLAGCGWQVIAAGDEVSLTGSPDQLARARVVAFAHGWEAGDGGPGDRLRLTAARRARRP
jgi:coenzyme F420-0:L-glutamate ligase/coenzyme F420-1:gamma-L-glutamate ligase